MIKQPYQVLKWYSKHLDQQYFKLQTHDAGWQILKYHLSLPPSFIIKRDTRGQLLSTWYLRNLDGTLNYDMLDDTNVNPALDDNFDIKTVDVYDYLTWERFPIIEDITPDFYYYEVSDGIETWYSEVFELCDLWDYLATVSYNGVPSWANQHISTDTGTYLQVVLIEAGAGNGATNYTNNFDVIYNEKLHFFVYEDKTAGTGDLTAYLEETSTGLQISTTFNLVAGANDFTIIPLKSCTARLRFNLANGLTFTGAIYVSVFRWYITEDSDCKNYSVLRWSDEENICDQPGGIEHYLVLDGQPHNNYTKIEETAEEDDHKNKYPLVQTLQKWFTFPLAGGDYLVEGLSILRLMDSVTLTTGIGYEIIIQEIALTSEPVDDYMYKITLDFREDYCSKDSCELQVEDCCCPNLVNVLGYEAGGTGALPDCDDVAPEGARYMVNDGGNYRIYQCVSDAWVRQTDEEIAGNCVYDENGTAVFDYDPYWYFPIGGSEFALLCTLNSVDDNNDGTATLNGTGPQPDEFDCTLYVQAQYLVGATWMDIGEPVSMSVFDDDGITVTTGAGNWYFRVHVYTHACSLSYYGNHNETITTSVEYRTVFDAMTVKPLIADIIKQDTMLSALIDGGYFAKAEFIDIFAVHTNATGEAQINWHNPGTFNPTKNNNPAFVAYQGFTGNPVNPDLISLQYNPVADGIAISQNNICVIMGVGNDLAADLLDFGGYDGTDYLIIESRSAAGGCISSCNDSTLGSIANANGKRHYAISRNAAGNYGRFINLVRTNIAVNSTGEVNCELHTCGFNNNGVPTASTRQVRYVMMFTYLTEAEVQAVIGIMETYLDAIGTGLY